MDNTGKTPNCKRGLIIARFRPHLVAWVAYTILTLALTYPLLLRLNSHLAGGDIDVWINPWANWWLEKAVTEGYAVYHTRYIFYPQGVSLVFHSFSPLNTFLWWLLKPLCGSMVAYNLTILLAYIMSGYSMWLLARYWTGSGYAAFLAGAIFAFSPYHIIEGAHPVIVTTQWIPLSSLYLIKALRERSVRYSGLSAVFFALSALSGWHLFFFAGLWAFPYVVYAALCNRGFWTWKTLRPLLALALLSLVLLAPLLYPILREQVMGGISYMAVSEVRGVGNHPWAFFLPSRYHPVLGEVFAQANLSVGLVSTRPAFMGYIALLMGLHAALKGGRRTYFWTLALLVFTLLSLEPYLPLRGGNVLRLPWAAPVVALFRHPFRFTILISFSLAMLAACDLAQLLHTIYGKRKRLLFTVLLIALVLFEYLTLPFPTTRPIDSSFYHALEETKDDFAVVELPIGRQPDKHSLYYQTIHGKRLVGGVVSRTPADAYQYISQNPLLYAAWEGEPLALSRSDVSRSLEKLARDDVRYVILKKYLMEDAALGVWCSLLGDDEVYEDDMLLVYATVSLIEE